MRKKTVGKVPPPPPDLEFNAIGLQHLCRTQSAVSYRLHSTDSLTRLPWPPIHFSQRDRTRFDPAAGVGTLCLASTLAGALMELFDDHWGPVGSPGRSVSQEELDTTWVTVVSFPKVKLFDASGGNLSKIGTDAQLLTGEYASTREWALRLMNHPDRIDGIYYPSRHDLERRNFALSTFRFQARNPRCLNWSFHVDRVGSKSGIWSPPGSRKSRQA